MIPSRLLLELGGALALCLILWAAWVRHDHAQQEIGRQQIIKASAEAVKAQTAIDSTKLAKAEKDHETELAQVATDYAAALGSIKPRIVRVPAPSGSPVPAPAAQADQGGPTPDGAQSCTVSADFQYSILVFAHRLDELNAEARAVNEALQ